MTAEELRSELDAAMIHLLPYVQAKQAAYLAEHGRYATLDWSHSTDPADGEVLQPDLLSVSPQNQVETWANFGYPVQSPRCNAQIDEYLSPLGRGYVVTLRFRFGDVVHTRSFDEGPGGFGSGWSEAQP